MKCPHGEATEEAKQQLGWMGKVNVVMGTRQGTAIWETMSLPTVNYAAEVRWKGLIRLRKMGESRLMRKLYKIAIAENLL